MTTASFRADAALTLSGKAVETDDGDLIIEGYASTYLNEDREAEYVVPGAFDAALEKFISGDKGGPMLHAHKYSEPIGRWTEARLDSKGLFLRGRVTKPSTANSYLAEIFNLVKTGGIRGISMGGVFTKSLDASGKVRITKVDLHEASLAAVVVNDSCDFRVVAQKAFQDNEQEETMSKNDELNALRDQVKSLTALAAERQTLPAGFKIGRTSAAAKYEPTRAVGGAAGLTEVNEPTVRLSELQRHAIEQAWTIRRSEILAEREAFAAKAEAAGAAVFGEQPVPLGAPTWFVRKEGQRVVTESVDENLPENSAILPEGFDALGRPYVDVETDLSAEQAFQLASASKEERPSILAKIKAGLSANPNFVRRRPAEEVQQRQVRRVVLEPSPEDVFRQLALDNEQDEGN
jgi:HK97 family phage prohead protease